MLKAIIVDDEPHAHAVLAHHCRADGGVEIVGTCLSAAEALRLIEGGSIDLMFLDIRMPLFGGLDLLRGLRQPPLTVIVSAHGEHALEGFELDVTDYLTKPVSPERFATAMAKVRRRLADRPGGGADLVVKVDRALRRLHLADIVSLEAQGNFVEIVTHDGRHLATATLKGLRAALPGSRFVQIHRSFIVQREAIAEQHGDTVRLRDGRSLPIGRSYRGEKLLA